MPKLTPSVVKKAMDADKVLATQITEGTRFEVTKGKCSAKFDLYDDYVNWVDIRSPGGEGWLKTAHDFVREVLPGQGVEYLVCQAGSDEAEKSLKRHGDWKGDKSLRWEL